MILLITSNSHRAQVRIYEEWEEHPMVGGKEHWIQMFGSCTKQASSPLDGLPPQTLPPPPCPNMWGHSKKEVIWKKEISRQNPTMLTLENELVPFLFHLVWILMTSSSLTHLPMDFIQWERKPELQLTSCGNRSPQPNHSTTRGLQASVSSSTKWQQQWHLLPGVLSKSNNISHERAKFVVTQRPFV